MSNIRTVVNPFVRVFKTGDVTGSWPTRYPVITMPCNDGVIRMSVNTTFGQSSDNNIHFVFFGTGNGGTFSARIIYWNKVPGLNCQEQYFAQTTGGFDLWVPEVVYNVDGVLGTATGSDNTYVDGSHLFASTLTTTTSTANMTPSQIVSPTGGGIASLTLGMSGPQLIEVTFNLGSATAMNAVYKTY